MTSIFNQITLMGRRYTEGVAETLVTLVNYLQNRNILVSLEQETAIMLPHHSLPILNRDQLAGKCDLIIVVGGDGSLLTAARSAAEQDIPVLGINRGSLGFLTDVRPDDIKTDLDNILNGNYLEESRFLLSAKIQQGKHIIAQNTALNDVVLLPSDINRMIEFSVFIDQQFVCTHRADGMIIATPTGSTAHALSGGGPILHPGLDAIVLLPMFPHTLSSRPIVVKGSSQIEIVMAKHCHACPNLSCDGQKLVPISLGDKIQIQKYQNKLRLIHLTHYNYYETLRVKLNWENKC